MVLLKLNERTHVSKFIIDPDMYIVGTSYFQFSFPIKDPMLENKDYFWAQPMVLHSS